MIQKDKIIKNITIFSGLQSLTLIIGVIRSKFAAVLLGTQGVGFLGLLVTTINLLSGIFNLGLSITAVKYLPEKSGKDLAKNVKIFQILSFVFGVIGGLFCLIFARQLSEYTFKTTDYTWGFRLLSISLLLKQLFSIYSSIIQSTIHLKDLANANILANFIGILFTLPIYYYFRIDGIIYNLLVIGLVEFLVFYLYFKKRKFELIKINKTIFITESKKILGDGFFINLSGNLTLLSSYLLQIFIIYYGGMKLLGYYFSAYAILNNYVSIIFSAMSVDYFPRISRNKEDVETMNTEVNFQIFIGTAILFPILLLLLLFSEYIIRLLFSSDFIGATVYLQIAILGVFFKLFSWSLGYVILAKGTRKMILDNAVLFNILFVGIHSLGFYLKGLVGIAISSNLYFLLHLFYNYWVTTSKLEVILEKKTQKIYFYCSLILIFCIIINFIEENSLIKILILAPIMIFSCVWSFKQMNIIFKWIK